MFFRLLGQLVRRLWPVLLAAWVALALLLSHAAPPWDEVARDREFAFLPGDAPSRQAEEVYEKAFPDDRLTSNVVLVLQRGDSEKEALSRDLKFIEDTLE